MLCVEISKRIYAGTFITAYWSVSTWGAMDTKHLVLKSCAPERPVLVLLKTYVGGKWLSLFYLFVLNGEQVMCGNTLNPVYHHPIQTQLGYRFGKIFKINRLYDVAVCSEIIRPTDVRIFSRRSKNNHGYRAGSRV